MKFRRTASSVLVSVFLVLAVLLTVIFLRVSTFGMSRIREIVRSFQPSGPNGIEIKADGLESTLMRSITINNISVSLAGEEILTVPSADISMTVFDVIKLALWKNSSSASVVLNDPRIYVGDKTVNYIRAIIALGSDVPEESVEIQAEQPQENPNPQPIAQATEEETSESGGIFDSLGISASFRNLSVEVDYDGFSLVAEGINATAEMGKGLVFNGADINIPEVLVSGIPDGRTVAVRDIRGSVDSGLGMRLSIADATYSGVAKLDDLSAVAKISTDMISAAVYAQDTVANLNAFGIGLDASLSGSTFTFNYDLGSGAANALVELEDLNGSFDDASFSLGAFKLNGYYDGADDITAEVSLGWIEGSYGQYSLDSTGLTARVSLETGEISSLGELMVDSLGLTGLEGISISDAGVSGFSVEYSYSKNGLDLLLGGDLRAHNDSNLAGDISASLAVSAKTSDFKSLDYASLDLKGLSLAALPNPADLSIRMDYDKSISASLGISDDVTGSLSYKEGRAELSLFATDLVPSDYKILYDRFLAPTGIVSANTSLSGSMIITVDVTDEFKGWTSAILAGDFDQTLEADDVFDLLHDGRISLNTAARDISVGESIHSGALTLEATVGREYKG